MPHRSWLCLCIVIGAALRLIWLDDMEYKGDQIYIFDSCQAALAGAPLPELGMPSGPGLLNPGMSLWWHIAYCRAFDVRTPLALAYLSPALAVLALLLAWWFVERNIPQPERPAWLWSIALASVSTLEVSLTRIIWSQTILPLFSVLFLWSYFRRETRVGALFWGLLGALVGQIHMSGFFFTSAFVAAERLSARRRRTRWVPWLVGTLLGALPMLPWLRYLAQQATDAHSGGRPLPKRVAEVGKLLFWLYGLSAPWGLELSYRLGFRSWLQFLAEPVVSGVPTYLIGLCHVAVIALGVHVYVAAWRAPRTGPDNRVKRWLLAFRTGGLSETEHALTAGLFGMGVLLTLTTLRLHRHYLIILFPLWSVFFCMLALRHVPKAPRLLASMWALSLCVTLGFLFHVHHHGGAVDQEYGTAYRHQATRPRNQLAAEDTTPQSRETSNR